MADSDKRTSLTFGAAVKDISRTLKLNWQLEPIQVVIFSFGAILEISGTIVSTYAAARLISLLFLAVQNPALREQIWLWLALSIISALAINLGFWLMRYSKRILYILASKWSTLTFMRQLTTIDIQTFHDNDSRNMINKLDNGHGWQISIVCNATLDLIYGIVRAIAIVAVVASLAWWVVPLLLLFLIPSLVAEAKTSQAGWFVWDEKGDERHVYWGIAYIMARARSQLEIRAMQAKETLVNIVEAMLSKFQQKQRRILRSANWYIGLSHVLESMGIALTEIWLLFRLLYRRTISINSYIFYSTIITRINGALNTIVGSYTGMQEALLYAHDFYAFSEMEPTIVDIKDATQLSSDTIPEIAFKDVWFRYPHSEKWVFQGLNFVIKPGEHLAIVGENGAGKTTLVKLLLRFYDVDEGVIEINGQDIRSIALSSWYKQLGTLFQYFNEYPLDVEHNVTISDKDKPNDKKLKLALQNSGLNEIVEKLPYGLETVLDSSFKKGTEPSGGQWQRVGLARAFYRNPNVLILDEPTSAIDARAEYEIFNNIFRNLERKTVIIISHRFSTVRRADRIIVLEQGKIIEEGNHARLMKHTDGVYKELFEKQAEGYR